MDYGHTLDFGVSITPSNAEPLAPVALARHAEMLGLDLVTFQDHPYQPRFHDTWTLLSWVAGQTERIRLAPNVLNVPLRQPAVLARSAASLDLLSNGRLELALGAGFFWDAIEGMGGRRLSPRESVEALDEAIEVIRAIWATTSTEPVFAGGPHHHIDGATPGPTPAHNVPIWIGGGKPRMLELIGREADAWVIPGGTAGLDSLAAANVAVDAAATAASRDPREIRRILNLTGTFTATATGFLAGPVEHWVEHLLPLVLDQGVSTLLLSTDDEAAITTFATEVAPALREVVAAERARRGTAVATVPSSFIRSQRRENIDYETIPANLIDQAVEPGDALYARTRSNYLRAGAPGLVLRPRTTAEVGEAVRWARGQHVPLAVRSGGHGVSGRSTNDGGIIIDVGLLNGIEVTDAATRRVRVGPGARWGEVASALRPFGWAISSGDSGGVGVGGLATAGGIGFLGRAHGLTIDHLRAVEMVLADGSVVRANDTENTELFWAVRGAGFNFGIVTSFEFAAEEVGDIGFGQLVHEATGDIAGFLERWGAAVEASPRDTTSFLMMGRPRDGRAIAQTMNVVDSDDPETILERLQRIADVAPLLDHSAQILPYDALVTAPPGTHNGQGQPASRSGLIEHITPEFAEAAERLILGGASYFFQIRALGGKTADVAPEATAFTHRSANFQVLAMGTNHKRLDPAWDQLHHHFTGIYLSFDTDQRPERLHDAFPPATLTKLRNVKRRYDPDNVFRDNFNITPAASGTSTSSPS